MASTGGGPLLKSPDLNPIENVWHELKLYLESKVKPQTKDELIAGIQKFWNKRMDMYQHTVGPLLSGHPRDFRNWPLNRGWPFNRGIEYCSLETLK